MSQSSIFSEVDFDKDCSLIAIAGYFSKKVQEYAIEKIPNALLLTYEIKKEQNSKYLLILKTQNNRIYSKIEIDIIEDSLFDSLPSFLQGYLIDNVQHRVPIISLIKKILSFSTSIRFETYSNYYSNGDISKDLSFAKYHKNGKVVNNGICAKFSYYYNSNNTQDKLYLSVYLPTAELDIRTHKRYKLIDGISIHTEDFIYVDGLTDINKVISKAKKIPLRYSLKTTEIDETYCDLKDYYINYRKYMKSRKQLRPIDYSDFAAVDKIVQIALEDWSVR